MRSGLLVSLAGLTACAATAAPPVASLSPSREAETSPVVEAVEATMSEEADGDSGRIETRFLTAQLKQGGLMTGQTAPGVKIFLDGEEVLVDEEGRFVFGFGRDHPATAELLVVSPSGTEARRPLEIAPQQWEESRITVEESKANPFRQEDLDKIAEDREVKDAARRNMTKEVYWTSDFVWPAEGCISSRFGYRRIINGTPRRYHSGVDVAAPDGMSPIDYIGTPIYAPADGRVTLASPDMFFEGGLVLIDHGQLLESALMHMSEVLVAPGDFVEQGDLIGRVGMEGRVTGPHLHWSLKWKDRLLDPQLTVPERPRCTPGL